MNLPAAQVQVAMGIPLHRLPDVRRLFDAEGGGYGESPIDFYSQYALTGVGWGALDGGP